ncbi:hypothetical protein [Candidatus Nitrospira bockiana]
MKPWQAERIHDEWLESSVGQACLHVLVEREWTEEAILTPRYRCLACGVTALIVEEHFNEPHEEQPQQASRRAS